MQSLRKQLDIKEENQCRGVVRLNLSNFRCYETFDGSFEVAPVVLTGPNGIGKTNLLEALSFLIPGRGLRRARLSEIKKQDKTDPWAISYHLKDGEEGLQIGTGQDPESPTSERRLTKINGEKVKSQSSLTEWVSMIWLTPQMDRLFLDGPSERRRFLDRLVYGFDSLHAQRLGRYEKALKERNLLLRQGRCDPQWLEGIEEVLVKENISITQARQDVVNRLRSALREQEKTFLEANLSLRGDVETLLQDEDTLEAEKRIRRFLAESREKDRLVGRTSLGSHRSDLFVTYVEKDQPAALCSTGEQKALLLSLVMTSAYLLSVRTGAIPLLLLDEVVAHLDKRRRTSLFDTILRLKMQVWLTGTDVSLFEELQGRAQLVELG